MKTISLVLLIVISVLIVFGYFVLGLTLLPWLEIANYFVKEWQSIPAVLQPLVIALMIASTVGGVVFQRKNIE